MAAIRFLLTIFLAVTAISMVAILAYYILGSDSDINGCDSVLPYCILGGDSDINGCDSVVAYYILGSDSDINGCDFFTCLLYS